jgi:hypothetical protein
MSPEEEEMKTRNIIVALGVVVFAASLFAQTTALRGDIPFQFYVGDKLMPAGHYTVSKVNDTAIRLHLDDSDINRATITFAAQRNAPATNPTMVFRHVGNLYFLSQIWDGNGVSGRQVPMSKVRSELAQKGYSSTDAIILLARK